jgi:ketosteroid isomerase-like protein
MTKSTLTVFSLVLLLTGCTQAPPPVDPSVITSQSDAWEAALNAGDVDGVVALYTSDARVLPPNREMVHGSAGVRAEFGAMIDAGLGGELTSVDTIVSGDIGYNVGTFVLRAGSDVVDSGKFIETWQRGSDGQWRISNDIYNSDMPVPEPESPETHLLITHEVDDAGHWLAAWRGADSRHKLFEANGAAHVHTFVSPDNPNLTGLVVAVNDMAALETMLNSEDGQAAAAADGVRSDTIMIMPQAQ